MARRKILRIHTVFFVLFLFLGTEAFLYAKETLSLSVSLFPGFRYGVVEELIYRGDTAEQLMSRLNWDQKPSPFLGIEARINISKFSVSLSTALGIPLRSGHMQDFDWLNSDPSELTHYSIHEAFLSRDLSVSVRGVVYLLESNGFKFGPVAGFSYRNRLWQARNGYGQYPPEQSPPYTPWNEDTPKTSFSGTVVSYEQTILFPSVGASFVWTTKGKWDLSLLGIWLPYVWVDALDNHYDRSSSSQAWLQFRDISDTGMGWNVEGAIGIPLNCRVGPKYLNVTVAYERFQTVGWSYSRYSGSDDWGNPTGKSGTKSSLWTFVLGVTF